MSTGASTVAVHRCRFVDFTPSPITTIAFPPLPLPSPKGKNPEVQDSHQSPKLQFGILAVGRANGNIEICEWSGSDRQAQAPQAWVVRKTLSGPFPSKVDAIAFTLRYPDDISVDSVPSCSDLRLFNSGGGSELVEWDLKLGSVRRTISSQGGSIWSIAANPASSMLAMGCEDGSVRLLSLLNDTLTHHRRFDRVNCRLLSLAWGPPAPRSSNSAKTKTTASTRHVGSDGDTSSDEDDEDDWSDSWLVTGGSDSSLRKWDVATGRVLDRMGTDKMRGERTLVWTVGVLGDGTIVSGDSLGMVKLWDSRTCTQLQSFQGHSADVLCLTISPEGTTIYTSGVDQKIVQFTHIKIAAPASSSILHAGSSSRWVQSCARRMHSHDVRALAIWPPHTPLPPSHRRRFPVDVAPILASGGLDMAVVLTPAAPATSTSVAKIVNPLATSAVSTFEDSYHRRLAYTSGACGTSAVQLAHQARLVCCTRDTGLSVWRILHKQDASADCADPMAEEEAEASGGWEKVLDMELNAHTNLIASAISDNGQWLAVSDLYETRLFALDVDKNGDIKPRRIRDFPTIVQAALAPGSSTGGSAFHFTPDSQKLVMATAMSSYLLLIDLVEAEPRVLRRFDHHRAKNLIGGERVVKKARSTRREARREEGDAVMEDVEEVDVKGTVVTCVSRMAISADGQWLATTDDLARTYIFNLDSVQHHCVLPSFPQPAQSLTFEPTSSNLLILTFPSNTFQIFDVEAGIFPEWSKKLANALPKRFTRIHDPILGMTFDPSTSGPPAQRALFWGSTWICKVNLIDHMGKASKKRRRDSVKNGAAPAAADGEDQNTNNFKLVTHYRPILHVEFLAPGELVVVERPLVDVLATLPPAYFKPKYGAS